MGRLQIVTLIAAICVLAPAPRETLAAPRDIHQSASLIVSAKMTCPKWCGKWETVWVTKANGVTTKKNQCKFWLSSCTDYGR
jgi:hypothetical protein